MFAFITHDTKAEHRRLFVAGIAFLTANVLMIGLAIAVYQKVFTPVTMVTVKADRAGLQLAKFGDVRIHGVLVGQVRGISQDGTHASIKIGMVPRQAKRIPANVSVEILPTTLFGQKYISLMEPSSPSSKSLYDGQVIPASRVHTNVELQTILANLFPLLRSIRPADLNATLYALSTALEGRGEKLGETMAKLDDYLSVINVHLPTVRADLRLLAKVTTTYSLAAPDLVRLLRNATVTANTVTSQKAQLNNLMVQITTTGATGTRVLTRNENAIVGEAKLARPLIALLDTYSPEFPCVFKGTARYQGRLTQIFAHNRVSQTLAISAPQRPAYNGQDRPVYGEIGHGPWCLGLPNPPVPFKALKLRDGVTSKARGGN